MRLGNPTYAGLVAFLLLTCMILSIVYISKCEPVNAQSATNWSAVDQAMGRTGAMQPGDAYKYSMPRSDLTVRIGSITVAPALALGSWVAFKDMGNGSMAMGDLVLTEGEVNPVMSKLQQGGIEQTGLHNHLLGESPRVMYMHIVGHGDPVTMAATIRDALALTKTPVTASTTTRAAGDGLDTATLDSMIGAVGKVNGGVYQFSIPRADKITDGGMEVPPSMGVAMPLNFQPLGDGNAAITGDFVLTGGEVNPVIRALEASGIGVTAVHNHMIGEEPRLYFLHFWATGDQGALARGLRAALDQTNASLA